MHLLNGLFQVLQKIQILRVTKIWFPFLPLSNSATKKRSMLWKQNKEPVVETESNKDLALCLVKGFVRGQGQGRVQCFQLVSFGVWG